MNRFLMSGAALVATVAPRIHGPDYGERAGDVVVQIVVLALVLVRMAEVSRGGRVDGDGRAPVNAAPGMVPR